MRRTFVMTLVCACLAVALSPVAAAATEVDDERASAFVAGAAGPGGVVAVALGLLGDPDPGDVAYVGDRVDNDVVPSSAAGMRAVWLRRGPWGIVPIAAPVEADLVGRVVVSTDDDEIAAVSLSHGAEVVQRPVSISGDEAQSESALLHVLDTLERFALTAQRQERLAFEVQHVLFGHGAR